MTLPLFDPSDLRDITQADRAFEEKLLINFQGTIDQCLLRMEGDEAEKEWKMATHELKGASASLGAFALAKYCADIEKTTDNHAEKLPALRTLVSETLEAMKKEILG